MKKRIRKTSRSALMKSLTKKNSSLCMLLSVVAGCDTVTMLMLSSSLTPKTDVSITKCMAGVYDVWRSMNGVCYYV